MTPARILVAVACSLALLGAVASSARADDRPTGRVVVASMPLDGPENAGPLFDRLRARSQLALGLMSLTQGEYTPSQALLDMTAGTRTAPAAYEPRSTPALSFVPGGDGTGFIFNWKPAVRRAQTATASIEPGLLASSTPGGIGYVGLRSRLNPEAVLAADLEGNVASVSLGASGDQVARVAAALDRHRVVVTGLATGARGNDMLDALIASRSPRDLLVVVPTPPYLKGQKLLPVGLAGLGGAGAITSDSTRLRGVIAAIDVPTTVLRHIGVARPDDMKGRPISVDGARNVASLLDLRARLEVKSARRNPTLFALLFTWLTLVLILGVAADRRGIRAGMRIGGLAVLWLLPILLVSGAVAPSRAGEFAIVVGGAIGLGAVTDRFVRWPNAPLVPAVVSIVSYAIDLAFGSPLIIRSLMGSNPLTGGRFFGLGNELEAVLAVLGLIAMAAVLTGHAPSRRGATLFAAGGIGLGLVVGSGRLGADVGGVITVGSGATVAALLMLPGDLTRRRVLIAGCTPVAGLVALALIDVATAGNGHFTRTVLEARSGEDLQDVVGRRYGLAYDVLSTGVMPFLAVTAALSAAYAVRFRARIYAALDASPSWRAGLGGGLAGSVIGSLTNDAGPVLLVFGVFVLACVTAYVRGNPEVDAEEGVPEPASGRLS